MSKSSPLVHGDSPMERVVLVALAIRSRASRYNMQEYLDELSLLVRTAGGEEVARFTQVADSPSPRTLIGHGKANEIAKWVGEHGVDSIVFDDELSPTQLRNLEQLFKCKVLDRTILILDIFAQRARTAYAKRQVELAQYVYLLPRLAGLWTHLERQQGGIGMRGPGEREIETDRRIARRKIKQLRDSLARIDRQMSVQRKRRGEVPRVALVGYTNVGKSSLMRELSGESVYVEHQLFATLDTTVRRVSLGSQQYLLSDTVGFIRKLPTQLVEAFKSTLDEIREADLLLHVIDVSHPAFVEQMNSVNETLREIGVAGRPTLLVFNKVDLYQPSQVDPYDLSAPAQEATSLEELANSWMAHDGAKCLFVSAKNRTNMDALRAAICEAIG